MNKEESLKDETKTVESVDKNTENSLNPEENSEKKSDSTEKPKNKKAEKESLDPKEGGFFEKIAELEEKCKDWQDQYLRKVADFDNYRKRILKEKQEAIDYANSNLLLDLVQILDDFDRAVEAWTAGKEEKVNTAFAEGVLMIKNQMVSMLSSKYGLSYYPAKGKPFDPNLHEAISMVQSKDVKEATVGEEIQKGYKLKERVIRHSKVMVFMPEEKEEKNENNTSDKDSKNTAETDGDAAKTDK